MTLSKYIDHTLLKATATENDIIQLCNEAIEYHFYAVCVNSCYVPLCRDTLHGSEIKIASVIGFPLGAMDIASKITEAKNVVRNGADEIDMVINIGFLKNQQYDLVENEIRQIKSEIGTKILKVIIETCYLTDDEKRIATMIVLNAGADFVKTSTGFGTGGATLEDVELMKSVTQNKIQIKASGGIRDFETAKKYIDLGVTRIGTSNGIQIVTGQKGNEQTY
ncbi:MAG TPA: deoxyribose-phosphate aldolase [Chitinophagales bacterium]|nr:deoxyribose-phosphate aldolase [Chitinophagales bacterium]